MKDICSYTISFKWEYKRKGGLYMERKCQRFYWGSSVSSFQTEGVRNEGGKGVLYLMSDQWIWIFRLNVAIDEYHRYDEDIALMKEMGFNFYRFSICWSELFTMELRWTR